MGVLAEIAMRRGAWVTGLLQSTFGQAAHARPGLRETWYRSHATLCHSKVTVSHCDVRCAPWVMFTCRTTFLPSEADIAYAVKQLAAFHTYFLCKYGGLAVAAAPAGPVHLELEKEREE